jgi:antitoxin component YwqK of YwqJK toxin-antitoxin module
MKLVFMTLPVLILVSLLRVYSAPGETPVSADDHRLSRVQGLVLLDAVPFTGTVQDGRTVTSYLDGLKHGRSESWYENGQKDYVRTYAAGREIGVHEGWWEDGSRRFQYHFLDGVHHGESKDWFRDGTLFRDFNYANGHENGSQKMYFEDGGLRANYVVKDGRRFGLMGTKPCTG